MIQLAMATMLSMMQEIATMSLRKRFTRPALLVALVTLAMVLAPSAFARSHWGVSLGFSGPGYSVGISDYRGHSSGYGYWNGYGSNYSGYGYAGGGFYGSPVYAYPSYGYSGNYGYAGSYGYGGSYGYSNNYYRPSYYPSAGVVYYTRPVSRRVVHRTVRYYDDDYRGDDRREHSERRSYRNDGEYRRDGYSRASYYDRGR